MYEISISVTMERLESLLLQGDNFTVLSAVRLWNGFNQEAQPKISTSFSLLLQPKLTSLKATGSFPFRGEFYGCFFFIIFKHLENKPRPKYVAKVRLQNHCKFFIPPTVDITFLSRGCSYLKEYWSPTYYTLHIPCERHIYFYQPYFAATPSPFSSSLHPGVLQAYTSELKT